MISKIAYLVLKKHTRSYNLDETIVANFVILKVISLV